MTPKTYTAYLSSYAISTSFVMRSTILDASDPGLTAKDTEYISVSVPVSEGY